MWERIDAGLKHDFRDEPAVAALLPQLTNDVEAGRVPASTAARRLLDAWKKDTGFRPSPE
jgi:LAO/AO transport system kinase